MAEATPPKPPSPAAAAGHAKGFLKRQPMWVWIAGATVLVGVAYMMYRRQQVNSMQDPNAADGTADYGPQVAGDYGGGYVSAAPTQGAYGGTDAPMPQGNLQEASGPDSTMPPVSIFFSGVEPVSGNNAPDDSLTQDVTPAMPTGGGTSVKRSTSAHKVAETHTQAATPPNPHYPHRGPHGWYRNEKDSRGRYHKYASGHKVYLK